MGFFGDMADLVQLGNEWRENSDVKGRLAQAQANLAGIAASMTPGATSPAIEARRVPATATVQAAMPTPTWVNGQPVVQLALLVELPSGVPLPLQVSVAVPQLYLTRLSPGMTIGVSLDPATPASLRVEWGAPA